MMSARIMHEQADLLDNTTNIGASESEILKSTDETIYYLKSNYGDKEYLK